VAPPHPPSPTQPRGRVQPLADALAAAPGRLAGTAAAADGRPATAPPPPTHRHHHHRVPPHPPPHRVLADKALPPPTPAAAATSAASQRPSSVPAVPFGGSCAAGALRPPPHQPGRVPSIVARSLRDFKSIPFY